MKFVNVLLKVWGWKSEKEQVGGESPGAGGAASGEGGHQESQELAPESQQLRQPAAEQTGGGGG